MVSSANQVNRWVAVLWILYIVWIVYGKFTYAWLDAICVWKNMCIDLINSSVWYKTKFGSQNLATNFCNHL